MALGKSNKSVLPSSKMVMNYRTDLALTAHGLHSKLEIAYFFQTSKCQPPDRALLAVFHICLAFRKSHGVPETVRTSNRKTEPQFDICTWKKCTRTQFANAKFMQMSYRIKPSHYRYKLRWFIVAGSRTVEDIADECVVRRKKCITCFDLWAKLIVLFNKSGA